MFALHADLIMLDLTLWPLSACCRQQRHLLRELADKLRALQERLFSRIRQTESGGGAGTSQAGSLDELLVLNDEVFAALHSAEVALSAHSSASGSADGGPSRRGASAADSWIMSPPTDPSGGVPQRGDSGLEAVAGQPFRRPDGRGRSEADEPVSAAMWKYLARVSGSGPSAEADAARLSAATAAAAALPGSPGSAGTASAWKPVSKSDLAAPKGGDELRLPDGMEDEPSRGGGAGGGYATALPASGVDDETDVQALLCSVRSGRRDERAAAAVNLGQLAPTPQYNREIISYGGIHALMCLYRDAGQSMHADKSDAESVAFWRAVQIGAARAITQVVQYAADMSAVCNNRREREGVVGALETAYRAAIGDDAPTPLPDTRSSEMTEGEAVAAAVKAAAAARSHGRSGSGSIAEDDATAAVDGVSSAAGGNAAGGEATEPGDATGGSPSPELGVNGGTAAEADKPDVLMVWGVAVSLAALTLEAMHGESQDVTFGQLAMPLLLDLCDPPSGASPPVGKDGDAVGASSSAAGSVNGDDEGDEAGGGSTPLPDDDGDEDAWALPAARRLAILALAHVANHEVHRAALVECGVLPRLNACLRSNDPELRRPAAEACSYLVMPPQRRLGSDGSTYGGSASEDDSISELMSISGGGGGLAPRRIDRSTWGWVGALMLSQGILQALVELALMDSTREDFELSMHLASCLSSLASLPHARLPIVAAGGVTALVRLAATAVAVDSSRLAWGKGSDVSESEVELAEELGQFATEDAGAPSAPQAKPVQFHTAKAMACLALTGRDVQRLLVTEGALAPLVLLLQSPFESVVAQALFCLNALCENDANISNIVRCGALAPLLDLAYDSSREIRMRVVFTLSKLASSSVENRGALLNIDAVSVLATLARDRNTEVVHRAVKALAALSAVPCGRCARGALAHGVRRKKPRVGKGGKRDAADGSGSSAAGLNTSIGSTGPPGHTRDRAGTADSATIAEVAAAAMAAIGGDDAALHNLGGDADEGGGGGGGVASLSRTPHEGTTPLALAGSTDGPEMATINATLAGSEAVCVRCSWNLHTLYERTQGWLVRSQSARELPSPQGSRRSRSSRGSFRGSRHRGTSTPGSERESYFDPFQASVTEALSGPLGRLDIRLGALPLLLALLDCPNVLVQQEACRALGHMASVRRNQTPIARFRLRTLVEFVTTDMGSPELSWQAERVLIQLGFTRGDDDVKAAFNDWRVMSDWYGMLHSVNQQRRLEARVARAAAVAWMERPERRLVRRRRFLRRNYGGRVVLKSDRRLQRAMSHRMRGRGAARRGAALTRGTAITTKKSKRKKKGGATEFFLTSLLMSCAPDGGSDDDDDAVGSGSDASSHDSTDTEGTLEYDEAECVAQVGVLLGQQVTSTSSKSLTIGASGGASGFSVLSSSDDDHDRFSDEDSDEDWDSEVEVETEGEWSRNTRRAMSAWFPSELLQRRLHAPWRVLASPLDDGDGVESVSSLLSKHGRLPMWRRLKPGMHVIVMPPSRTFSSFLLLEKAVGRVMASSQGEPDTSWSFAFRDSVIEDSFAEQFVETLHRWPAVQGLSFANRGRRHRMDSAFATIVGDFPPWMKWLTFDNALSVEVVPVVALLLRRRLRGHGDTAGRGADDGDDAAGSAGGAAEAKGGAGSMHRRRVRSVKGLSGLAIRNHAFKFDELAPIIELLTPQAVAIHDIAPRRSAYLTATEVARAEAGSVPTEPRPPDYDRSVSAPVHALDALDKGVGARARGEATPPPPPPSSARVASAASTSSGSGASAGPPAIRHSQSAVVGSTRRLSELMGYEFGYVDGRRAVDWDGDSDVADFGPSLDGAPPHAPPASLLSSLAWLDLSGNRLGDSGAASVLRALADSKCVRALDLSGNAIHSMRDTAEALCGPGGFLARNSTLRTLHLAANSLRDKSVARVLNHLARIRRDYLAGGGGFGPGGWARQDGDIAGRAAREAADARAGAAKDSLSRRVRAALGKLTGLDEDTPPVSVLRTLDLRANGLQDAAVVEALGACVERNRSLRVLMLQNNALPTECGHAMCVAVMRNPQLWFLRLHGNHAIRHKDRAMINKQLRRNRVQWAAVHGGLTPRERPSGAAVGVPGLPPPLSLEPIRSESSGTGHDGGDGRDEATPPTTAPTGAPVREGSDLLNPELAAEGVDGARGDGTGATGGDGDFDDPEYYPKKQAAGSESAGGDSSDAGVTKGPDGEGTVVAVPPRSSPSTSVGDDADELERPPTLTCLFSAPLVYADGSGTIHPMEMLNYELEREFMWRAFREASRDIALRFDFATTQVLRNAVTLGSRALHFSGHGDPDFLSFEDGFGKCHVLGVDLLRSLLAAGGPSHMGEAGVEFVFVSACYSRRAGEAFVAAGVPHVVAVNVEEEVLDNAAIAFTRQFYLSLAVGDSVADAFAIGQQAVKAAPNIPDSMREGSKFLLLPADPDGVRHNVPVFPKRPKVRRWPPPTHRPVPKDALAAHAAAVAAGELSDVGASTAAGGAGGVASSSGAATSAATDGGAGMAGGGRLPLIVGAGMYDDGGMGFDSLLRTLPSVPEHFLGRNVVLYKVLSDVLQRRLVTLTGPAEIGKTAIAVAVAHYVAVRQHFPGGVYFVKLKGHRRAEAVRGTIVRSLAGGGFGRHTMRYGAGVAAGGDDARGGLRSDDDDTGDGAARRHEVGTIVSDPYASFEAQSQLFRQLQRRRALLILDHCDEAMEDHGLKYFLGQLLDDTKAVKIVVTCRRPLGGVPGFGEAVHPIQPLAIRDAAHLLGRLCRHMGGGALGNTGISEATARNVAAAVHGVPGRIVSAAVKIGAAVAGATGTARAPRPRLAQPAGAIGASPPAPVSPRGGLADVEDPEAAGTAGTAGTTGVGAAPSLGEMSDDDGDGADEVAPADGAGSEGSGGGAAASGTLLSAAAAEEVRPTRPPRVPLLQPPRRNVGGLAGASDEDE